ANRVVAPSGRRWWEPGDGRPLIPFGLDRQWTSLRDCRSLVITEGESDTIALHAALATEGYDVIGVPGCGTWRPSWARYADGYSKIYVAGDGDLPGRKLDASVTRDVPGCVSLAIPTGQDVRSILQAENGTTRFLELVHETDAYQTFFSRPPAAE